MGVFVYIRELKLMKTYDECSKWHSVLKKIQIILFKEHCSTHTTDFMQTYCPLSYIS